MPFKRKIPRTWLDPGKLFFAVAILAALAVIFIPTRRRFKYSDRCRDLKKNLQVLTFAYDNQRTGRVLSCLPGRLRSERIAGSEHATEAQPLIIQGRQEPELIFMTSERLRFWGIRSQKILRDIELPHPAASANSSSPAISLKHQMLYGLFFSLDSQDVYRHWLYQVSLKDHSVRFLEFTPPGLPDLNRYLRCRTSLALSESDATPRVMFGCSLGLAAPYYAHKGGIRGAFVTVPLDQQGRLPRGERVFRYFYPNKWTSAAQSGRDGGIWMSGGAATELSNGNFAFTTGNGLMSSAREQFSCALLQVDAAGRRVGRPIFPYLEESESFRKLCETEDMDLTSGVTKVADLRKKSWLGIVGKDSTFRIYTESDFKTPASESRVSHRIARGFFGQPVALVQNDGSISWFVGGRKKKGWVFQRWDLNPAPRHVRKVWEVEGDTEMPRSSPALAQNVDDGSVLLIFSEFSSKGDGSSNLLLVDGADGSIKSRTPFSGAPHFTMPVVFADRIFLSVSDAGIIQFSPH